MPPVEEEETEREKEEENELRKKEYTKGEIKRRWRIKEIHLHVHLGSSPTRGSSFYFGKVTALGVLCCFAMLFV